MRVPCEFYLVALIALLGVPAEERLVFQRVMNISLPAQAQHH